MTLPKNKRRSIAVDGMTYHWTRGRAPEDMWVTVQLASGEGSILRIDAYGIPLPADIAEAIRFAIANGWNPIEASPFHLGFTTRSGVPRISVRSARSGDFWREFV